MFSADDSADFAFSYDFPDYMSRWRSPTGITHRNIEFTRKEFEFLDAMHGLNDPTNPDLRAFAGHGYSTPFVAPIGPDGGTDVLAYPDPVGAQTPHVRVQVKHRSSQKATREEIAALRGIIRQGREIGLFVSTAGFSSDAVREARQGGIHVELADLERLLQHWIMFYDRLSEEDKAHLRLRKVYFLAPE